jgi:predicted cupin superfamily sugar epimerase
MKTANSTIGLFSWRFFCLFLLFVIAGCKGGSVMNDVTVSDLVEIYDLQPHPEGGFYREVYRDEGVIPAATLPKHGGDRNYSANIYFLIPEGKSSNLHRLKSDETWHFYLGGPLTIVQIMPDGTVEEVVLGRGVKNGQKLQHVVKAGVWFGAYPREGSGYSFVGCTVAPAFDFSDFELGKRDELLKQFSQAERAINMFSD